MSSYITLKQLGEYRFEDRRSEFIGYAKPVSDEASAIDFVNAVKKKYPDAKHWVYAYILRENSAMRFTDDREPQGTAGMPVLDSMRKRGITDAVVVVVRYFGGVLLGTGGLVHAYTEAASGAINKAAVIKYDLYSSYSINVSYSDYQRINSIFAECGFIPSDTEYLDTVRIKGDLPTESKDKFISLLSEATAGRAICEFIEEKFGYRE